MLDSGLTLGDENGHVVVNELPVSPGAAGGRAGGAGLQSFILMVLPGGTHWTFVSLSLQESEDGVGEGKKFCFKHKNTVNPNRLTTSLLQDSLVWTVSFCFDGL